MSNKVSTKTTWYGPGKKKSTASGATQFLDNKLEDIWFIRLRRARDGWKRIKREGGSIMAIDIEVRKLFAGGLTTTAVGPRRHESARSWPRVRAIQQQARRAGCPAQVSALDAAREPPSPQRQARHRQRLQLCVRRQGDGCGLPAHLLRGAQFTLGGHVAQSDQYDLLPRGEKRGRGARRGLRHEDRPLGA